MPSENVRTVEKLMDAFHRRDIDAIADLTTQDVEWVPVFAARVEGAGYRGREGIETFVREVGETWGDFHPVPEEYRDLGQCVLALGRLSAKGRTSGAAVDAPWAGVFDFRANRVFGIRTYLDHSEALRAVGLEE